MRERRLIMGSCVAVAACVTVAIPAAAEDIGGDGQAIVGGSVDPVDPSVVMMQTSSGLCTGSVIAPTVVLTAAHCIQPSVDAGDIGGTVYFGTRQGEWFATRNIADMIVHRYYEGAEFTIGYDIAMLRLASPAPAEAEPLPYNRSTPLDGSYIGAEIRTVGFGGTGYDDNGNLQGVGTKRHVTMLIDDVTPDHVQVGDEIVNTCQGDSGGPSFVDLGNGELQVGVTSFGETGCRGPSKVTRVDAYSEEFVDPIVDAWSGPCQDDGACVTEGCRTPDPDCDPDRCGFDGVCGEDCPQLDLDCPVGGLPGELCQEATDCDSRHCLVADDDPRVSYCSMECDPDDERHNFGCEPPLNSCEPAEDGTHLCGFAGPTPSTQGAECESGADCRSDICDTDHGICVEPCGEGQPACPAEYACEERDGLQICTVPDGGGCSAVSGARNGLSALAHAALVLVALGAARARRRRARIVG